jgi:aldehyde:ferredoxin oxidoreductase
MFNVREGAIWQEMTQRTQGSPPQKKGPIAGNAIDIEVMVQGYYAGMGFQQDGILSVETLHVYGLDEMIPDLTIYTGEPKPIVNDYIMRTD